MTETNVYVLGFISNTDENIRFSIPRANKNLEPEFIGQRMHDLISIGIISTPKGRPVAIESANLVTTEVERIV